MYGAPAGVNISDFSDLFLFSSPLYLFLHCFSFSLPQACPQHTAVGPAFHPPCSQLRGAVRPAPDGEEPDTAFFSEGLSCVQT